MCIPTATEQQVRSRQVHTTRFLVNGPGLTTDHCFRPAKIILLAAQYTCRVTVV